MKITSITDLEYYISTLASQYLEQYYYLDCSPAELQRHLTNFYQNINADNQPALLFTFFENDVTTNGSTYQNTFICQIMIVQKADKNDTKDILAVRNRTLGLAWQVLGQMVNDEIATLETFDNGIPPEANELGKYTINLPDGKILPETDVASMGVYGWSIPFDLSIPINDQMFTTANL